MKDIIADAHKKLYTVAEDDLKREGILISNQWMAELQKYPYHSSKLLLLTFIEQPGTGIFLMKEKSKLYKPRKSQIKHVLSKRLSQMNPSNQDGSLAEETSTKRKNLGHGMYEIIQKGSQQQIAANNK